MTRTVQVWGETVEIDVFQRSKIVWIARGTYLGEHVEVKSKSPGAVVTLWRKTAEYRGG